jgi:N-formylglutamate amidohydrolase
MRDEADPAVSHFTIREPDGPLTPVVVEVPHAGLQVDAPALATLAAPARALGQDADLYVDELYADAPAEGATLLVAHTSRYVCDLNRGEHEVDRLAAEGGTAEAPHGLIWRTTTEDVPALYRPLSRAELERRLREVHRPYHAALSGLLQARRRRFGFAVLLCGHSMPSRGRAGHMDPGRERADVVPGSRGGTTGARQLVEQPELEARERGWSVAHDDPYKGGYATTHYGRPHEGVHAVQVELARRLYMDEQTLEKKPGNFEATRSYCRRLVARLVRLELG